MKTQNYPSIKDVEATHRAIRTLHPRAPALRHNSSRGRARGRFTVTGLMLAFFATRLGKVVDKQELVGFLRRMRVRSNDPQPRHIGMQLGFDFLVAGCVHPRTRQTLKRGQYCLLSIRRRKTPEHRTMQVTPSQFQKIKARFAFRCASCGSGEGQPHLKSPRLLTRLERGHMHPKKVLDVKNCIPMCAMCNSVYKNKAVFNARGFICRWLHSSA